MTSTSLAGALPELRAAYDQLTTFGLAHGISFRVADFGGVRTQADTTLIKSYRTADYQQALNAGAIKPDTTVQQFRPINDFGSSWHNYGAAFDVFIVSKPAGLTEYDAKKQLGSFAPTLGLRWGGRFTNPDTPHFELAIPLSEAKARYAAMTGQPAAGVLDRLASVADDWTADDGDEDASGGTVTLDDFGSLVPAGSSAYIILGLVVVGAVAWAVSHNRQH